MKKAIFIIMLYCLPAFSQQATLVSTVKVTSSEIANSTEYIGTVQYESISPVAAERAGRVDSIGAEAGKTVKKGDALVSVNTNTLKYNIETAKSKLAQQKATMEKYQRDYDRAQAMFNEQTVSEQHYQNSATDLEIQKQLYNVALNDLYLLQEDLNKSTTRAPFDGVVLSRNVTSGQWVNIGTVVYEVAARKLEVVVNVPQSAINVVNIGLEVPVKINNAYYQGKVRAVVPQGNANLRTFPVKIDIPYSDNVLGGMDCTVLMPLASSSQVLIVPRDAIITKNNSSVLFIIDDGKAKALPVKVTGYSGTNAGVQAAGLSAGMDVITRGSEQLRDGQSVRIQ